MKESKIMESNQTITKLFQEDCKLFHEKTHLFYAKELTVAEYKGFSGGFGSYGQRGGTASMLRLRLTGGEISKEQLHFIASCIEVHNIPLAHITTCQSIQFHHLSEEQVCTLVDESLAHGIITRGGGGDFPRNVMCSPLSGVEQHESFDVMPFARQATEYLLTFIHTVKLPRKLKVCFSNGIDDSTHATFRDLGFVANNDQTFDIYSAGGLGRNPRMGVQVGHHVPPCDILYYIKAMIDTFTAFGNYENRAAARTRFMQETLGNVGYQDAFAEKLATVFASEQNSLKLTVLQPSCSKIGDATPLSHPRVITQKQNGLYAVSYYPIAGNPPFAFWKQLSLLLDPMPDVSVRLTPDGGMYVIHLTASEAQQVLKITDDGAKSIFETSIACIGAAICQVGIGNSQALLHACIERTRTAKLPDGVLPQIHISGCPSSCSAHQIAALGFRGGIKQTPEGPKPAFAVYENGNQHFGEETFGTELGVMIETDIPEFLTELGTTIANAHMNYKEFVSQKRESFLSIVQKYI